MSHELQFYIDGAWVDPVVEHRLDVIDPSNEDRDPGRIALSMMSFQLLPRTRGVSMVGPMGSP